MESAFTITLRIDKKTDMDFNITKLQKPLSIINKQKLMYLSTSQ